ncbi:MAG: hypothetical protein WCA27_07855 [Candidatus Sulfotelmatobacter sp.]
MEDDHTGNKGLCSPLKVRELRARLGSGPVAHYPRLENVDPDFVIVIGKDCLLIVDPSPVFCLTMEVEEAEISRLTEQDQQFLHELHIK